MSDFRILAVTVILVGAMAVAAAAHDAEFHALLDGPSVVNPDGSLGSGRMVRTELPCTSRGGTLRARARS
jgi:hypothetical protein